MIVFKTERKKQRKRNLREIDLNKKACWKAGFGHRNAANSV